MPDQVEESAPIPVIGLAGGIGAGKSTVARAFADLGCHVIDFDADVRAALERDEVAKPLRDMFGPGVLDASGRVDRGAVARIVFADPDARKRLEGLLHPIVWRTREEAVAAGRDALADCRGVIMDAPLLFEAGLDRECDEVVFVDAPLEERVRRVRESRAWSENDLREREDAQMPLAEKRARCDLVITNHDRSEDLTVQAARVLGIVRQRRGAKAS